VNNQKRGEANKTFGTGLDPADSLLFYSGEPPPWIYQNTFFLPVKEKDSQRFRKE
jgi:hypothetical protein